VRHTPCSSGSRDGTGTASGQMMIEARQRSLAHLGKGPWVLMRPVENVLRGTKVLASRTGGITGLTQGVSEHVDEGPRRTVAKCTKSSPAWVDVR